MRSGRIVTSTSYRPSFWRALRPLWAVVPLFALGLTVCVSPIPADDQGSRTPRVRLLPEIGHDIVTSLAFSPDGRYLASVGGYGEVVIWEGTCLAPLALMRPRGSGVRSIAFDPTGRLLASCGQDGRVVIQSVPDGTWMRSIRFAPAGDLEDPAPWCTPKAVYSRDGRGIIVAAIAKGGDGQRVATLKSLNASAGDTEWEKPVEPDEATSFCVSADGSLGAVAGSAGVRLISTDDGSVTNTISCSVSELLLGFSPDASQLVGAVYSIWSRGRAGYYIWNTDSRTLALEIDSDVNLRPGFAFSPDGQSLATTGLGGLWLRDCVTGHTLSVTAPPPSRHLLFGPDTFAISFSPSGQTLALGGLGIGLVSIGSVPAIGRWHRPLSAHGHPWFITRGERVFLPSHGHTSAWILSLDRAAFVPGPVDCGYHLSADADAAGGLLLFKLVDTPDSPMQLRTSCAIWGVSDRTQIRRIDDEQWCQAALSPDGQSYVLTTGDTTRCFSASTGRQFWASHLGREPAFSPNSRLIAQAGPHASPAADGIHYRLRDAIVLTDASNGQEVGALTEIGRSLRTPVFSHDGRSIAAGTANVGDVPGSAFVWDVSTRSLVHQFAGHSAPGVSVAFGANDRHLATASGSTLTIWDIQQEKSLREFGHELGVCFRDVGYSRDGRFLLSTDDESSSRIWNPDTGELLLSIAMLPDDNWVLFTPQRYYSASAGADAYAYWGLEDEPNGALQIVSLSQYNEFHRPDIVRDALRLRSAAKASWAADNRGTEAVPWRLPPVVEIVQPQSGITTAESTVHVTARVSSPSGDPVIKVRALVNGRPSGSDRGLAVGFKPPEQGELRFSLPLTRGDNVIQIVADTEFAQSRIEQGTLHVTCTPPQAAPDARPDAYVLCIGCNEYSPKAPDLAGAVPDARSVADMLRRQMTGVFGQISVSTLFDQDASRSSILLKLEEIAQQALQKDLIVIYFAGHGISKRGYYFIPYGGDPEHPEVDCIAGRSIQTTLEATPAHVLLLLDTCHASALFTNGPGRDPSDYGQDLNELLREYQTTAGGIYTIAATTQIEQAADQASGHEHSPFTLAILEALSGKADCVNGLLTLNDLDHYVTERVRNLTGGRQHVYTNLPPGMSKTLPIANAAPQGR